MSKAIGNTYSVADSNASWTGGGRKTEAVWMPDKWSRSEFPALSMNRSILLRCPDPLLVEENGCLDRGS